MLFRSLLGAGVGYRASIEGPQAYADRMALVMKSGAAQVKGYAERLFRQKGS